jgi:hypothetical protein
MRVSRSLLSLPDSIHLDSVETGAKAIWIFAEGSRGTRLLRTSGRCSVSNVMPGSRGSKPPAGGSPLSRLAARASRMPAR